MSDSELERLLLQHVRRPNYRPVKPRVIAKQLDLPEEVGKELKRAIKRLVKQGKIAYGKNHLVQSVQHRSGENELIGRFRRQSSRIWICETGWRHRL